MKVLNYAATSLNLKIRFAEMKLSCKDVRKLLSLASTQAIYKWINPGFKSIPSIDHLVQLADILDCTIDELIITDEIDI